MATETPPNTIISRLEELGVCCRCTVLFLDSNRGNRTITDPAKIFHWSEQQCIEYIQGFRLHATGAGNSTDNGTLTAAALPSDQVIGVCNRSMCPCCCNCLGSTVMAHVSDIYHGAMSRLPAHALKPEGTSTGSNYNSNGSPTKLSLYLSVQLPPIIEVTRGLSRYAASCVRSKPLTSPTFEDVLREGLRLLAVQYPHIVIIDQEHQASYQIKLIVRFNSNHLETELSNAINPQQRSRPKPSKPFGGHNKNRKRKRDEHADDPMPALLLSDGRADGGEQLLDEHQDEEEEGEYSITCADAGKLMTHLKSVFSTHSAFDSTCGNDHSNPAIAIVHAVQSICRRSIFDDDRSAQVQTDNLNGMQGLTMQCRLIRNPVYLLGRYRKLARDVPQAPWTLDNNATSSGSGGERKGRLSVEELIGEAVCAVLGASACRLHGCGREDIDVRCLGNGRPFVLEVLRCTHEVSEASLEAVIRRINAREGSNASGDVEVPRLAIANKSTWETMQAAAEEKKKGYCCVVWTQRPVDRVMLATLAAMASATEGVDVDTEGRRCLQLAQKTPLRVLHRRTAMTRPKHIYDIETALLNDHFFVMRLVTAPGTYVKEFVHGDLGRTEPSVCSILGCQAEILQLDVIKLFDAFPGGADHRDNDRDRDTVAGDTTGMVLEGERQCLQDSEGEMTWTKLQMMRVASAIHNNGTAATAT